VPNPSRPRIKPPPGAWDTHAHIFGPADKFPYQPGRGYTPPDAPVERFIALLDHLGFANGLVVQGNAHVYDNRVVLDALTRFPARLRGVAITTRASSPRSYANGIKSACGVCAFICFRSSRITSAASGSMCSRSFARP
jgi:predicted TIM-barrel fold metal-dependent hydrolase